MLLVSIVIPVYNGERYLTECMESCLNQTYKDIEIIAVNDGSTDHSPDILESYSDRIRIVTKANGGTANALNVGIDNMKSEWFKWVSADDMLYPDAIESLVSETRKVNNPGTMVFMDDQLIYEDGSTRIPPPKYLDNASSAFEQAIRILCNTFGGYFHTGLIHASVFEKIGRYNENLSVFEDHEMGLRACMQGLRWHHVPKIIYKYRMHSSQTRHRHDVAKVLRMIESSALDRLGEDEYQRYSTGMKTYLNELDFRSGVWHYANMYRPAESAGSGSGIMATCARHAGLRAAYRAARFFTGMESTRMEPRLPPQSKYRARRLIAEAARRRHPARMQGWFWARRHKNGSDVARARRQDYYEFVTYPAGTRD